MFTNPSVADFKNQFFRDFPYGTDPSVNVVDQDITAAFVMTNINVNQDFFADQSSYNVGYLLLSAHYMVLNMRASSQGINGQYNFLQQSKNAGAIAEAFAIPQRILDNPELAMLCKTNYGAQYLHMILPQFCGNYFSVGGHTKA